MIGILIAFSVSWLLLWLFDKRNLSALGLSFTKSRFRNLLFGFLISAICCAVYFLSIATITKTNLSINANFTEKMFLNSCWWTLKSVFFEELLFRGALLYIGIQKLGVKIACILSAVLFGVYHWFSYNVFDDPVRMIYVFIITGTGGLIFAYAFALTKSLYLPIGLHLGWNLVTIVIFSQGPLGQQFLINSNGQKLSGFLSVVFFLYQILTLPLITYWYLKRQTAKALVATKNDNR